MRALALATLALLCAQTAGAQEVKMAQNGACYAADDPYNPGIIPLQSFTTLDGCLEAGGWDRRGWGNGQGLDGQEVWMGTNGRWSSNGRWHEVVPMHHPLVGAHAAPPVQGMVYGLLPGRVGAPVPGAIYGPTHMDGYASTHATPHGSAHGTVYGPTHGAMYGPTNGTMYRSPYGTPHGPTDGDLPAPAWDWTPLPALPAVPTRLDAEAEATRWMGKANGCRNHREELLSRLSRAPVAWSIDGCRVAKGVWVDAARGTTVHDPERIEVSHVVPPIWAQTRGADAWDQGHKTAFYTDPNNLVALVVPGANDGMAQDIRIWEPHSATQACTVANAFATVVYRHRVDITRADAAAILEAGASACRSPSHLWLEGLDLERNGFTHAERTGFDATRGVIRTPKDTAVRFAPDGTYTAVPFAPDAQGRPERGIATGNSMVFHPTTLPNALDVFAQRPDQGIQTAQNEADIDAGVVLAEKPPIALPGRLTAPAPIAPPPVPTNGTDTATPGPMGTQEPPEEPTVTYNLEDFNGMRVEEIVNVVNGNTIVRGINDDGSPLDPVVLLQRLGFPPAIINATMQEAFEEDDPERARTVVSPLGGPEVQTDPNLPAFDADPMMLGIGAEGAGLNVGP
jgi:hypothetical protein